MTKYALVTGASSGIGRALAIELSKNDFKVIACSPPSDIPEQEALERDYQVISLPLDLSNSEDISRVHKQVEEITGGQLDVLYNNAGISVTGPVIEIEEAELNKIFQINAIGQMNLTRLLAPLVIKTKGTILFTNSSAAQVPLSWVGAYSATKAALDAYALTLHGEMAPFGVRVHSVVTGGVDTQLFDDEGEPDTSGSLYDVDGFKESLNHSTKMARSVHITPDKYAEEVVKDIQRKWDPGFHLYHGARSNVLHWASMLLPLWFMEMWVQFYFKQSVVFKAIAKRV
ncbi:NADPH-dependent 1-acyldihydroxyacetone phosphate reductase [Candida viswanathii]|uniref:NADPH-dependent 1-acyldihydroxyacetone phosphate reductase n=1 Tax=Candida viswanathii TaxID=5486 RepID=A0A367XW96_9ASCO|nr:NADPH-dependent 1-acyldihydroxyacetone phosphate reductase [Candida viswanathii]